MLVVKGGFGLEVLGFLFTLETIHDPFLSFEARFSASFLLRIKALGFVCLPVSESKSLLEIIFLLPTQHTHLLDHNH